MTGQMILFGGFFFFKNFLEITLYARLSSDSEDENILNKPKRQKKVEIVIEFKK